MDFEQTSRWLDRLYEDGDTFELVAIKNGKAHRKTYTYGGLQHTYNGEKTVEVREAIRNAEEGGWNVYASAMPLNIQETGTYDRVWVDMDALDGIWPWGTDAEVQWPQPATLVKTSEEGGGFRWQAIWKLAKPLDPEQARSVMKRLANQIGADGGVHDARRILRVPGVVNAKRGTPARLMDTHEGTVSLDAFDLPTETAVSKLLSAEVQNPNAILGEWLAGVGEGERNKKAYVAARFLRSTGVVHDDALAIVALGASRCDPPLDENETRNAVRSAYHGAR